MKYNRELAKLFNDYHIHIVKNTTGTALLRQFHSMDLIVVGQLQIKLLKHIKTTQLLNQLKRMFPQKIFGVRFFFRSVPYNLKSSFVVRSQLGPCIQLSSSSSAGFQVIKLSIDLLRNFYPQLLQNPHHSKNLPPKLLHHRSMPRHPVV